MTPRQWQIGVATLVVVLAVALQFVIVSRLPGPVAGPALVLVAVVAVAMAGGQTFGAVAGFGAGLALDLLPPADSLMGSTALALVVVGYVAGRVRDPRGLAPVQVMGVAAGLAAGSGILMLAIQMVLGGRPVAAGAAMAALAGYVVVSAALAPLVVPVVGAIVRRVGGARRSTARRLSA
ncbi:MAG: rod shape-determining protein MreD [Candidatus Nanopelagicales bacterium]